MAGNYAKCGFAIEVRVPEVSLNRVLGKAAILHQKGVVQSQAFAKGFTLTFRDRLAHHLLYRVTQVVLNGEGQHADDEHHQYRVHQPLD